MRTQQQALPPDIEARLGDAKRVLTEDSRVIFAYLFGGLGKGRRTPLSDIDIAVYLKSAADIASTKMTLINLLMQFLNTDAVDLVILNDAPLSLAGRIQRTSKVLVDKAPPRRYAYESLIRREFADFLIQERAVLYRRFGLDR